ncbi:hypothetical protein [Pseudoalteromonas prydzensis]|uniref:hypothetical protein n=1 Tax=Pseudoalteromonas prydzensis TaxID=182141 RepID=UPI0007E51679|nr:hypothetical protein [Pseudoalteromonas prydzensis]MBE0379199.1 hypothetical protein [Pseudoalteromonas prydzensis ACAM 620]
MSLKVDNQNQFVLISSLILNHTAKNFPCNISLSSEELYKVAYEYFLHEHLESMADMIEPTITWLNDEKYIRKSPKEDKYTITEKGLTSLEYKITPAPLMFKFFTHKQNGQYLFFKETGYSDEQKLQCTGPALTLLPENWYQFGE